jgi:hypothetical protein
MAERIVTDWATAAKGPGAVAGWLARGKSADRAHIDRRRATNTNDSITAPVLEHGDAVTESGSDESGLAGAA